MKSTIEEIRKFVPDFSEKSFSYMGGEFSDFSNGETAMTVLAKAVFRTKSCLSPSGFSLEKIREKMKGVDNPVVLVSSALMAQIPYEKNEISFIFQPYICDHFGGNDGWLVVSKDSLEYLVSRQLSYEI